MNKDNASAAKNIAERIKAAAVACGRDEKNPLRFMEVCGTHTMAIAKSGIRTLLPENIKLLSGPGCPVCVTPGEVIDRVLELAMEKNVIITTYGE